MFWWRCAALRRGEQIGRRNLVGAPLTSCRRLLKIVEMLATRPKTLEFIVAAMLDPLTTAEILALRLQLQNFGSKQHDPAVQFHCLAVDSNLGEALDGRDDQMLREVLASSVAQLDKALWSARLANSSAKEADSASSSAPKNANGVASLVGQIADKLLGG
jgi:hypothetical protein